MFFQSVELRIAVDLPPLALGDFVAWLGGHPIARFLVLRRNVRWGTNVFGPDRASAEQKRREAWDSRQADAQPVPFSPPFTEDHEPTFSRR